MNKKLKLASTLVCGMFSLGMVTADDVVERVDVTHEQPGVWNESGAKCSCYPYLMTPGVSDSKEACAGPAACYELTAYTADDKVVPQALGLGEVFSINGAGTHWSQGFMRLLNEDADTGIHFYDEVGLRHRIWNNNDEEDLMRISPFFPSGGLSIDQSGHVGVNRGNQAARTHLDVNGVIHLNVYSSTPAFPGCNAFNATDGLVALTSNHTFCVCNTSDGGGWRWVNASDGTSNCVW